MERINRKLSTVSRRRDDPCFSPSSREERECFGIRYGNAIIGLIFGGFIVIIGIGLIYGKDVWAYIGPGLVIILGLLIVLGAISALCRRRSQTASFEARQV